MGSVRSRDQNEAQVIEALRRAKFKYPGRQKIVISKKWGFSKWPREQYEKMRADGFLPDGVNCQYKPNHGPLDAWKQRQVARSRCFLLRIMKPFILGITIYSDENSNSILLV